MRMGAFAIEPRFGFDENYWINAPAYFVAKDDKYLLSLLNSKMLFWALGKICSVLGDMDKRGRIIMRTVYIEPLPIRRIDFTNPVEKSQHDELAALADKMLHLNKRLHNELEQMTFLQICDEINPNRLPLKGMGDRFRIAITDSKRKKLTSQVIETFELGDGELGLKDDKLTARIQADETAISFLRAYLAHIEAETLDTLNAEYPKLEEKIRNLPVPDLTIEEMSQALSRWEEIEKEKESLVREIQDTDNLIDAKVFRLYGLEREEIVTVLDSLGTEEEIKTDILNKWERETEG